MGLEIKLLLYYPRKYIHLKKSKHICGQHITWLDREWVVGKRNMKNTPQGQMNTKKHPDRHVFRVHAVPVAVGVRCADVRCVVVPTKRGKAVGWTID